MRRAEGGGEREDLLGVMPERLGDAKRVVVSHAGQKVQYGGRPTQGSFESFERAPWSLVAVGAAHRAARSTPKQSSTTVSPMGSRVRAEAQDRKSTRLNSSHSQISYAVFCLKKQDN